MNQQFRALILRRIKWGESDLILHLLTDQGQKRAVIAKGALRSRKRFGGGVLEPFHLIRAEMKPPREVDSQKLGLLLEADLLEDFGGLRNEFIKIELGARFLNTVSRVTQEGNHPDPRLFELLGHSLTALVGCKNVDLLSQIFDIKLLWLLGVLPLELQSSPLLKYSVHDVDQVTSISDETKQMKSRLQFALERVVEDGRSE